jgi:kelch-like protein 10
VYAGGHKEHSATNSGEKYNPETNTWTRIPDMHNQRAYFSMVAIDDMMFAIGGENGSISMRNVEYFDDRKNEWFVCLLVHDITN